MNHAAPRRILACALLMLLLTSCGGTGKPTAIPEAAFRPPTAVSTPFATPVPGKHVGPASLYPNPALTPGDTLPVTADQVCVPGYSKGVRSVTNDEKKEVYAKYGLLDANGNWPSGKYEVDHFTSLELGGSNDIKNLWPEPYVTPDAAEMIGAHEKDAVENALHAAMCPVRDKDGKITRPATMTIQQAQQAIQTDWVAIFQQMQRAGVVTLPATEVP